MKKIKYLRKRNGHSLRSLAKKAGISPTTLQKIEAGEREAYPVTLRAIAEALEVPVAALFDDEDTKEDEEEKTLQKVS